MAQRSARTCVSAIALAAAFGLMLTACGDSGDPSGSDAIDDASSEDDSQSGDADMSGGDADMGGGDADMGGGDTHMGGGDADMGGGDADMGGGDSQMGGGDADMGGGDSHMGGGDADMGGEDADMGGGDAGPGDEDVIDAPVYDGPLDQCVGVDDVAAFINAESLGDDSAACLVECAGEADIAGCSGTCMQDKIGVSGLCATCFGATATCLTEACGTDCLGDDEEACGDCFEWNCQETFNLCTGLDDAVPSDQCLDVVDFTTLAANGPAVFDGALACAAGCEAGDADPLVCTVNCIEDDSGLSEGCSVCSALLVGCVSNQCSAECLEGDGTGCDPCLIAECGDKLTACMGFDIFDEGPGTDLCLGVADTNIIEDNADFDSIVEQCASGCTGDDDVAECVATCAVAGTGLSSGCASCYGELSQCLADSCTAECFGPEANSSACNGCADTYCGVAFGVCAGLFTSDGACTSPQDLQAIDEGDLDGQLDACSASCDGADDLSACLTECFTDGLGVSPGCVECQVQLLECAVVSCPGDCGVNDPACEACLEDNCLDDYLSCTGFGDPSFGGESLCLGEADLQAIDTDALDDAEGCTNACAAGTPGYGGCVKECLESEGLSDGCAGCFADVFVCSVEICNDECFGPGANADDCSACQDVGCGENFVSCSGFDSLGGGATDQCSGESDIVALDDGSGDAAVEACNSACAGDLDVEVCMAECMALDGSLTEGCSSCFIDLITCQGTTCAQACVDSPGAVCNTCIEESCGPDFAACAGFGLESTAAVDQCLGATDTTVLQDGDAVNQTAVECTLSCAGEAEFYLSCAADCITEATGLSGGCSGCYAKFYGCFIDDCGDVCSGDTPDDCNACLLGTCSPDLLLCTGDVPVITDGACTNLGDAAIFDAGLGEALPDCSVQCTFDAQPEECAGSCIEDATGLTAACAGCFVDYVVCSSATCFDDCDSGWSSPECNACLEDECAPALTECAGFAAGP